jgi:2-polyprenyl-3-methyl-5-hydroxy-6-metoxy-1,4-benzoquinol methylase
VLSHDEMVGLQAEKHDLVATDGFRSNEEFVLHLMHSCAYAKVAQFARGKVVLDLGCNVGYGSDTLARSAKRVTGVDVSRQALDRARARFSRDNLSFLEIDGRALPFEDGSHDVVVACQVIEHVVDYGVFLGEIKRVLTRDGVMLITTPNAATRLDPGMKPWNEFHVREFLSDELQQLLAKHFRHVCILGLFGTDLLASIELGRVHRARDRARAQLLDARVRTSKAQARNMREAVKQHAPAPVVALLRNAKRTLDEVFQGHPRIQAADREFMASHDVREFFYGRTALDQALDLLAICGDDELSVVEAETAAERPL